MLLIRIPTGSKFFKLIHAAQSLIFQLMNLDSTFLLSFWKETVMPQGFTESSYFLQILKADGDDITFPRGSTLLQYIGDLLLCFSQTSSQEVSTVRVSSSAGTSSQVGFLTRKECIHLFIPPIFIKHLLYASLGIVPGPGNTELDKQE